MIHNHNNESCLQEGTSRMSCHLRMHRKDPATARHRCTYQGAGPRCQSHDAKANMPALPRVPPPTMPPFFNRDNDTLPTRIDTPTHLRHASAAPDRSQTDASPTCLGNNPTPFIVQLLWVTVAFTAPTDPSMWRFPYFVAGNHKLGPLHSATTTTASNNFLTTH
jgi:hypothetical protein